MLNENQIIANWERFSTILTTDLTGPRKKILIKFYEDNAERFSMMPASSNTKYHNAFPGGYIDHVLGVYNNALALYEVWKNQGAYVNDFTLNELKFAVLNHDLGKFGTEQGENFIPQTSDWHRNKGEIYSHNGAIPFMKTPERSLFILQSLGVSLSENEYMAIKLHDGLYEESNKSYLISYSDDYRLRPHLSYILHQADLMASRIEYDNAHRPKIKGTILDSMTIGPTNITTTTVTYTEEQLKNIPTTFTAPKKKAKGKYDHLLNKK